MGILIQVITFHLRSKLKLLWSLDEQGKERAEYGKQLLTILAKDLTPRNGRGFSRSNLLQMCKFYLAFQKKWDTVPQIDMKPITMRFRKSPKKNNKKEGV